MLDVERAFVAAATAGAPLPRDPYAAGAVASRYLAVGTPRSMSFAFDVGSEIEEAILTLEAHRTWFQPIDLRCARSVPGAEELAACIGGRAVSLDEAFAADIVNIHGVYCHLRASQLRRGTHVNVLTAPFVIDDDVRGLASVTEEATGLPALAAGLVDGRQLDEITICFVGDAPIALAGLAGA